MLNCKRFEEVNDLLLRAKALVFYPIKYQIQGFQNRRFHWPAGFLADTFGMNGEYGVEQLSASSQAHPTYKTKKKILSFATYDSALKTTLKIQITFEIHVLTVILCQRKFTS